MTKKNFHWTVTALVTVLALACTSGLAYAAVVTFDNDAGNKLWGTPTNWDTDSLPLPADDVVVPLLNSGNNVEVDIVTTVNSLQIGGGGGGEQVRVMSTGDLTVSTDILLGIVTEDEDRQGDIRTQADGAFLTVLGNIVANSTSDNDIVINRGTFSLDGDIIMEGDNRIDQLEFERGEFLLTGLGPQTLTTHQFRMAYDGNAYDATFELNSGKTLITTNTGDTNGIGASNYDDAETRQNRAEFFIRGGSATFAGPLQVGATPGTGANTAGIGFVDVTNSGTLTANNGLQLAIANANHASVDPNLFTSGDLTVDTGATVTVAGGIRMAEANAKTVATITIDDGLFQLTSGDITTGDAAGTGTSIVNLTGGTFELAATDAVSHTVTQYNHADGATLKVTVIPDLATLKASTMTLASSTSSGGSVIDLNPSPTASTTQVIWDGGTAAWDGDATKWNPDSLPANGTVIRQNDQLTILQAGSIANSGNAKLDASDTAGWSIQTSSTQVKVTRTGSDLVLGPAVAVIDNSASIVTRDSDLNVQFAAGEGADASGLNISDGSLTLSGTNNLILGAGSGQGDVNQSGPSTVTVGGVLQFGAAAGDTGGVYTLSGGTLDVQGNVGGKSIVLADPDVATATLSVDGGTLTTAAGVEIHRLIVGNENDAALSISDSTFSARTGDQLIGNAVGVTASLTISGTADVKFGDAASGSEAQVLIGGEDNNIDHTTNGTVTLSGTATVSVYGGNTEVGIDGNGTLDIQGGTWTQLTDNLVISQDHETEAAGTFTMSGGVFDLRPSTINNPNQGNINFNDSDKIGGTPSTATFTGGTMYVGNDIQMNNRAGASGVLTIDGGDVFVDGDINYRDNPDGTDTVNLKSGKLVFSDAADVINAINTVSTGTSEFNWTGGTISGLEEFNGLDLVQKDTDAPSLLQIGSSAGTMTIGENYLLDTGDNTLQIELFAQGTTGGTDFDLLTVTGNATLAGSIDVLDASEGAIDKGTAFEWNVMEANEITLVGAVTLPTGFDFRVIDDADGGTTDILQIFLEGLMGIAGDYNNNGTVEQADLDLVLLNWGKTTPPIPGGWENDLPEGQIDQAELDKVLLNWGATSGAAAAVPEPATGLMLILGMAAMLVRRKVVLA